MSKIHVKKRLIESTEISEIDFDLYDEFGVDTEKDDELVLISPPRNHWGAEGYPINIDRVIKHLQDLKDKGATHVEMDYHCDHIGYEIDGYEYLPATDKDVEEHIRKEEEEERARIQKKKEELQKQIDELG